jgi:hypothetical protein
MAALVHPVFHPAPIMPTPVTARIEPFSFVSKTSMVALANVIASPLVVLWEGRIMFCVSKLIEETFIDIWVLELHD